MTHPLGFEALKDILHHRIAHLPDHRKQGPNTQYAIHDAALGAFGIFFTQSASFLEYQRRLQPTQGRHNLNVARKLGRSCGLLKKQWLTSTFQPPNRCPLRPRKFHLPAAYPRIDRASLIQTDPQRFWITGRLSLVYHR